MISHFRFFRSSIVALVGAAGLAGLACLMTSGCGYNLQTSDSPLLHDEGISKIYIVPLVNNTFKVGIENVVYNALVRSIVSHRRVILVTQESNADAILRGYVTDASSSPVATQSVTGLAPTQISGQSGVISPPAPVAYYLNASVTSIYQASISCNFTLVRRVTPPGKKALVWSGGFARAKQYPSSIQLGPPGTTSALINDSEFDRALSDVATSMMSDVHESMLAMF